MKAKFLMTAAALTIAAGGANAQVVDTLATLAGNYGGAFANVTTNFAVIEGGVTITASGQNGGSSDGDDGNVTDLSESFTGVTMIGQATSTPGTGAAADLDVAGGLFTCDADGDSTAQCDIAGSATFSDIVTQTATLSETTAATTTTFGNIATLAAGAVNSTTTAITETGATIMSGSMANTSDTASSADFDVLAGSGVIVLSGAYNDAAATVNGAVSVTVSAGDMLGGDIGTTVVGATSTADITAAFVGSPEVVTIP